MRNLRLLIAYEGTRYHGWQKQPGLATVEGRLREVLSSITQTDVALAVAGRTDAGVHARGQVANFRTESPIDPARLRYAANSRLDPDILIRRVEEAADDFDATLDARAKHYRYAVWASRTKPPYWLAPYYYHWYRRLDVEAVARAARHLVGRHDFKSFETTSTRQRTTTVRTLYRLDVSRRGPRLWLDFEGDGFLYNMVRNIAGTLLEVGRGRWTAEDVPRILSALSRAAAGPTAPARGLTLMKVFYDEDRPAPPQGVAAEE